MSAWHKSNFTTYFNAGRVKTNYLDGNVKKTTFTYDKNKVTQTMNNTGQVYTKTIDATGQLINATDPGGAINYTYFSSGNLKATIAPSCTTSCEYDKYHNQKKLIDPNAGTTEYEYNAYGEIVYQKDAKGNWFRYTKIDRAGRPLIKTSSDGNSVTYTYDTDFKGALCKLSQSNGTSSQYLHDSYGRVTWQKETILGSLYETKFDYDTYSNVQKITYPSGFNINYTYNPNGYLTVIKHTNSTTYLWSGGDVNALGEWINFNLGTSLTRSFTYNTYGMVNEIKTNAIQSLKYDFNIETGNLTSRKDVLKNLTETFTYNTTLDQLTSWKVGTAAYTLGYKTDGTSRIDNKTDAGTYVYGSAPAIHRVTGINGNPGTINNVPANITYTSFNKLDSIYETGIYKQGFEYGADEQRRVSRIYNSSNTKIKETIYIPGGYEIEKCGTVTRKMHYIPVGDSWALYVKNSGGQDSTYFLLTDHLGSVNVIASSSGTKLKEFNFDPWGRRRNPVDWTYTNVPAASVTSRGFTMHEHMDQFKIINMNGRVYDPVLGQFLSPDPFIGDASSTQSYNRYAYCNYNPLKYTDPSGYYYQYEGFPNLETVSEPKHSKESGGGGYFRPTVREIVYKLWYSPFGGSWTPAGGYYYFSSRNEGNRYITVNYGTTTYYDANDKGVTYIDGEEVPYQGSTITVGTIDISVNYSTVDQGQGGGHTFTDYLSFGFSAGDLYYSGTGSALQNDLYWVQKNGTARLTSNIGNNYLLQRSYRIAGELAESAKIAARSFAYTSTAISGINMVADFRFANTFDFAMGLTTFLPGVGWAISGLYFISNVAVESYSGKTIGEHLEMQINKIGQ